MDKLNRIDNLLASRRTDGSVWAESAEQLVLDFASFINELMSECETLAVYLSKNDPDVEIDCHITEPDTNDICVKLRQTQIVLEIHWPNIDLNVRNANKELIQVVPGKPISIKFEVQMLPWFNNYHVQKCRWSRIEDRTTGNGGLHWKIHGNFRSSVNYLNHPYISSNTNSITRPWTNVCLGDLNRGIGKSLMKKDWNSLYNLVYMWLNEYIVGYTGPLNQPYMMHLGVPSNWNEQYPELVGSRTNWCHSHVLESSSATFTFARHAYCNDIECQIRPDCLEYKEDVARKDNVLKALPDILDLSESDTPIEDWESVFNRLEDRVFSSDVSERKYYLINVNDWIWLIKNCHFDFIAKYFGLDTDWWDGEITAPESPTDDTSTISMREEMAQWAANRITIRRE
tara:strand:- start:598 stop:1797 length:1200 start_codon:yes stop_codon:yes gene_type:complete